jgi:hypothetical protein
MMKTMNARATVSISGNLSVENATSDTKNASAPI